MFRFGFVSDWDSTTLFVLNLAFSDLLYCLINLPLYAVQYLYQRCMRCSCESNRTLAVVPFSFSDACRWPLGEEACRASVSFRYVNAFAEWMSLAFIAVSRCLGIIKPAVCEKYLAGRSGLAVMALIWLYALGLISPVLTKVSLWP